jgi:porin
MKRALLLPALAASAALAAPLFPASLAAKDPAPPVSPPPPARWAEGDTFTGDWGGLRTDLQAWGLTIDAYYVNNIAGNVSGGFDQGAEYADNVYVGLLFDLEKLWGWEGSSFLVSAINRSGDSITAEYVGSQFDSMQVVGGQTIFLYQAVFEQKWADDRASLRIGRFSASDDFNTSPLYGYYMSNAFDGNLRAVLFNTQFSAYPFATWGARVRFDPTPETNLQFGIFQAQDDVFDRDHHGLDFGVESGDGVWMVTQVGWTPVFGGDEATGLPGHYWFGAYFSPWEGYTRFGTTEKVGDSYGFYLHGDQMVYRESAGSDQGLVLWSALTYDPNEDIAIMPFQVNVGAVYRGLLPGRDRDATILGLAYGRFSDDYAGVVESQGGGRPGHEMVLEAAYRYEITKFAYVQPGVQYVIRPGGTGRIGDAFILGVQMGVKF